MSVVKGTEENLGPVEVKGKTSIDFSSVLSAEEFNGLRGRKNSIGVTGMCWTSQKVGQV